MSKELSRKLGYEFNNIDLLKLALTHRSRHDNNNERLEFLGDSIVNFVIADALYQLFPRAQEGELSRRRATLINRETLGDLARDFDMGRFMHLGPGELKSGGSNRQSILSCAMEAVIGAIYLDGGFAAAQSCILRWYDDLLQKVAKIRSEKDPKTQLQEYLQSRHLPLPVYTVENLEGDAHQQTFLISCAIDGVAEKVKGKGTSRRRAEQDAAMNMLGIILK